MRAAQNQNGIVVLEAHRQTLTKDHIVTATKTINRKSNSPLLIIKLGIIKKTILKPMAIKKALYSSSFPLQ